MIDEGIHQETILALRELKNESLKVENTSKINAIGARILYYTTQFLSSLSEDSLKNKDNIPFYIQMNRHVYDLLNAGVTKEDKRACYYLGSALENLSETLELQGACDLTYELENKLMKVINTISRNYE